MKKAIITIIVSLFCITAFADIRIALGNSDFLKEEETAVVIFDYSKAIWNEESVYEQWCGDDYANRVNLSYGSYVLGFNNESTKLKIKQEDPSAKYRITVKITLIEEKHGALLKGGLWRRYYVQCSGTIVIEDIATGEVVCIAEIDEEEGERDLVINDRLAKCFYALGKSTAKMK